MLQLRRMKVQLAWIDTDDGPVLLVELDDVKIVFPAEDVIVLEFIPGGLGQGVIYYLKGCW